MWVCVLHLDYLPHGSEFIYHFSNYVYHKKPALNASFSLFELGCTAFCTHFNKVAYCSFMAYFKLVANCLLAGCEQIAACHWEAYCHCAHCLGDYCQWWQIVLKFSVTGCRLSWGWLFGANCLGPIVWGIISLQVIHINFFSITPLLNYIPI